MSKENYYSSAKLRKVDCDYYIIIGQKSNGKSYDIKSLLLREALKGRKFAYMRRWKHEKTAKKVEKYFSDETLFKTNKLGNYSEVQVYSDEIFLGNRDDKGKATKELSVGYSVALSSESEHASLAYPSVYNILFEEFITDSGYMGRDEITLFNKLCSTVLRRRKGTHIYMIGNTINRFCPYFSEFNIDITKINKGDIIYYNYHDSENNREIKIGLEYCNDIFTNPLVFGKSAKMINGGEWLTSKVPLCTWDTRKDKLLFTYYVQKENSIFKCLVLASSEIKEPYIFVYPYTKKDRISNNDRFFTDKIELQPLLHSACLTRNLTCDIILSELYKLNKICYSDSLTGTEFEQIRTERGWK